jgi:predicted lipoprotein with Yx(FWY)xxD motif
MFDQKASAPPAARMKRGAARIAALVGAGLLLAACGDDATSNSGSGGGTAGGVGTRDSQIGKILTDSKGMTLYFADQEADGKIRCVDTCLSMWAPVMMDSAPSGVADGLAVMDRQSSGKQLTFQGKPLYTFRLDTAAGDTRGDRAEDDFSGTHFVWHAAVIGGQPQDGGSSPTSDSGGYGY